MNPAADNARKPASFVTMLEAGVQAIAETGVDRISVSQLCKITGHTRPTFYSYFGDTTGLLAEIWLAWGADWLGRLADFDYRVENDTDDNQRLNLVLTEIVAIAHRSPEVLEVVQPAFEAWWSKFEPLSDFEKLRVMFLAGERIGRTITAQVDAAASSSSFIEPVLAQLSEKLSIELTPLSELKLPRVSSPAIGGQSTESQLIQAAADVIASSGVAAASMARIARKAQVSTGSIYPRFSNLVELVDASFELSVNQVIEQNFAELASTSFSPEDFGLFIMSGLGKARTSWRNFRVEIHLEGRLRDGLRQRITLNLRESNERVSSKLVDYKLPAPIAHAVPYLIHNIGVGFAVLQNAGLDLLAIDHRKITIQLVGALAIPR